MPDTIKHLNPSNLLMREVLLVDPLSEVSTVNTAGQQWSQDLNPGCQLHRPSPYLLTTPGSHSYPAMAQALTSTGNL